MGEKIARFRFVKYHILKTNIDITNISNIGNDIEIEINQSKHVDEDNNKYKLSFDIIIQDVEKSIFININAMGFFEFDNDLDETEKQSFFNVNAPAILFPYIRAYISTLTSLSGVPPLILPTINLAQRD